MLLYQKNVLDVLNACYLQCRLHIQPIKKLLDGYNLQWYCITRSGSLVPDKINQKS